MKLTMWRNVVVLHSKVWRKGDEDYFSQSHVYVLRTATTRHMESFIDFYFHFLAKLHLICSLYLPMLCPVSHTVSLGYPWFTAYSIYYCGRHLQFLSQMFLLPQIPKTVQLSTEKIRALNALNSNIVCVNAFAASFADPQRERYKFHSLLGSVGELSVDKLLLSSPSLIQSHLRNLLKSSRHVTSPNRSTFSR